jgi:hypothetical protein
MSSGAGYSGTPLAKKLGIKPGMRLLLLSVPTDYRAFFSDLPERVVFAKRADDRVDLAHLFVTRRDALKQHLAALRGSLRPDAMVWVSWPKKAAKVATDVTEDTIREVALSMGYVDIKVCAVTEVWSGLKLVVRKESR